MKIAARIALTLTVVVFIILCLNVLYLYLSLLAWGLNIKTEIFYPVVGVLIPIVLLINMINLLHACDYEDNIDFFYKLTTSNKIKIAIYASMGLINPMLLYLHTKSYNHPVRIFGILRCFPIVNIFMYLRLIKKLKLNGYLEDNFLAQYFRGILILTLIREEKRS